MAVTKQEFIKQMEYYKRQKERMVDIKHQNFSKKRTKQRTKKREEHHKKFGTERSVAGSLVSSEGGFIRMVQSLSPPP